MIFKRISGSDNIGSDSLEGLLTLGSYLVRHHRDVCHHGVMVDSPEDIERLESWFHETIQRQGDLGPNNGEQKCIEFCSKLRQTSDNLLLVSAP